MNNQIRVQSVVFPVNKAPKQDWMESCSIPTKAEGFLLKEITDTKRVIKYSKKKHKEHAFALVMLSVSVLVWILYTVW